MKFLSKTADSNILKQGLTYLSGNAENNAILRNLLLKEQKNFCAYTEKYIDHLDSVEVEHFNSSIKYNDDYYNYYAVLRRANLYKKDEQYKGETFFDNLFFQTDFESRIQFLSGDLVYEETNPDDTEARNFIDFIGLNYYDVYEDRKNHINRLKDIFSNPEDLVGYFRKHKEELKFITAIEVEFELDLSEFYR